jgi:hypothetical protein
MLHSAGYRGELAYRLHRGIKVPVQARDIIHELDAATRAYYNGVAPAVELNRFSVDQDHMRRAILELEADGLCERRVSGKPINMLASNEKTGNLNGREIWVWLSPRPAKPEVVKADWETEKQANKKRKKPPQIWGVFFPIRKILKLVKIHSPQVSLFLHQSVFSAQEQAIITQAWENATETFVDAIANGIKGLQSNEILPTSKIDTPPAPDSVDQTTVPPQNRGVKPPQNSGVSEPAYRKEKKVEKKEGRLAGRLEVVLLAGKASQPAPSIEQKLTVLLVSRGFPPKPSIIKQLASILREVPSDGFGAIMDERRRRGEIGVALLPQLALEYVRTWEAYQNAVQDGVQPKPPRKPAGRQDFVEGALEFMRQRVARGQKPL